jgi:hypothetical protein
MVIENLLIVDDLEVEQQRAYTAAKDAFAYKWGNTALTLSQSLTALDDSQAVLSDLFFPIGDINPSQIAQYDSIVSAYIAHAASLEKRYTEKLHGPLYRSLSIIFPGQEDEVVQRYLAGTLHWPNVKVAADIKREFQETEKLRASYDQANQMIQKVRSGEIFPSGYVLAQTALERNIPIVIVTSQYHHDAYMQPLSYWTNKPQVSYIDSTTGEKNWEAGVRLLLQNIEKK